MKKIIVIGLTLFCVVLGGCKNNCIQKYEQTNIHIIDNNSTYNNWEDFIRRFTYLVHYDRMSKEYPYYSKENKTYKICGYVKSVSSKYISEVNDTILKLLVSSDSTTTLITDNYHHIECPHTLFEKIDTCSKCYIEGKLSFGPFIDYFLDTPADPHECISPRFTIKVTDIKN